MPRSSGLYLYSLGLGSTADDVVPKKPKDPVRQAALTRQLDWLQPHIRTSPPPLYVASQLRPDEEPVQDWQESQRYTDLPSEQQRIIAAAMVTRNTPTSSPGLFNPAVNQKF